MEIKEITSQQLLDRFVGSQDKSQFLQSWIWGEFQKSLGRDIWHFGIYNYSQLVGSALVIKNVLPLGKTYYYCPRGPVIDNQLPVADYQSAYKTLVAEIVSRAEKQGAMFIKIEPLLEKHNQQLFNNSIQQYEVRSVHFVQPQDSWYLNLEKSEQEILSGMHQKTRYNIRLAERKGVTVRTAQNNEDFKKFWLLNVVTAKRDHFRSHSHDYYYQMFKTLGSVGFIKLFLAEFKGEVLAANLVTFFSDSTTYIHGASSDKHRNVMAPHLLQWRQIQTAKKEGFKYYDFWGVAPEGQKDYYWAGITRFKKGFGGQGISYLGAYDIILDKFWYTLYQASRKLRFK